MNWEAENINDLLARFSGQASAPAPFTDAVVTRGHEVFARASDAWQALVKAQPRSGWLQWQSHQQACFDGLPQADATWGVLLAAELVVDANTTLEVRMVGGQWCLVRTRDGEGQAMLADSVNLQLARGAGQLCYRRYWRQSQDRSGFEQAFVRLWEVTQGAAA